jgi:hypothetical protein
MQKLILAGSPPSEALTIIAQLVEAQGRGKPDSCHARAFVIRLAANESRRALDLIGRRSNQQQRGAQRAVANPAC